MSALREPTCRCGHIKSTHHEGRYNCLAVGCNECTFFGDEPAAPTRPSNHPHFCRCYECKRALGIP